MRPTASDFAATTTGNGTDVGGRRGNPPAPPPPPPQQYENAVVTQRLDQLIVGYFQRMGYMQAAAALYNESAFLPNASSRQPVAFINDRLHDQTLETIIEQICATGGFGVSQNLLDMGAELRNFTSRFTEMTAQMAVAPGRNNLQAQLYGRPARPRPVQNSRPAPQARAALELQRIAQIGERRYQEQQQAQAQVQQQQQRQNPKTEEQKNPSREPLEEGQISETPSSQESTNERASRRKIQQPQSLNSMVTHAMVDPIVGYISERSLENVNNIEVEQQFIQQYPGYEMLDLNFISAFDYEPEQDGQPAEQQVQQDFDPVFEQIMNSAEEQNFSAASLPVEAEVVVETAKPINSAASTPNIRHPYQFPDPSPLLSPLPRGISFRVQSKETVVTAIELEPDVVESPPVAPPLPAESSPSAKRREAEHHRERKEEKEHRKERRHGEGNSAPKSSSRSSPSRRRSDEKRRQKDKKEDREDSMHRDREKRHDESNASKKPPPKPASSSSQHHQNHHHHDFKSDRDSTTSSSSRATVNGNADVAKRDAEKRDAEKRRKEKESRKPSDAGSQREREREKEKMRNIQKLQSQQPYHPDDSRNARKERSIGGSDQKTERKRKADETIKNEFKIPKKTSSAPPPPPSRATYGSQLQSGPLTRESLPSSSTGKSEKSTALSKVEKAVPGPAKKELSSGDTSPDRTRFLTSRYHIARLCSMLVNADKQYDAFQKGLQNKKNQQVEEHLEALSDIEEDEFSETSPSPPAAPTTAVSTNPKSRSFAPHKGYAKNANKSPSSEESSGAEDGKEGDTEHETDSEDDEDVPGASRRGESDSPGSPAADAQKNKYEFLLDNQSGWNDMLERIHKK